MVDQPARRLHVRDEDVEQPPGAGCLQGLTLRLAAGDRDTNGDGPMLLERESDDTVVDGQRDRPPLGVEEPR